MQEIMTKIADSLDEFTLKEGKNDDWKKIIDANKDDDYSYAVVKYAERVMSLAEGLKKAGSKLENTELLRYCEILCNDYGITGFQHGAAVSIMRCVWAFSDDFLPDGE